MVISRAIVAAAAIATLGGAAWGNPFSATHNLTSDMFFPSGLVDLDFEPLLLGGTVFEALGLLNASFETDFSLGSFSVFDALDPSIVTYDGDIVEHRLIQDPVGDDTLAFLLSNTTPTSPGFAVATLVGDLDGGGSGDFLIDGVLFEPVTLTITGAAPIPLPAGMWFMLAGLGGFAVVRKARRA